MTIAARFPGSCAACRRPITIGERIEWDKANRRTTHVSCSPAGAKVVAAVAASRAQTVDIEIPCPEGLAYRGFQQAGIALAASRPATLIGDEMGLGKTIQALGLVNLQQDIRRVLVICPASLRLNWQREAERWLVRPAAISVAIGDDCVIPEPPNGGTSVTIINYDILARHTETLRSVAFDLAVLDEAHYIKNPKARRSTLARALVTGARIKLALTGTPIPNRPIEAWHILATLDPQTWDQGGRGYWRFAYRYAGAYKDRFGVHVDGASNLPELQERLRSTILVRRLKQDVLTELPAKQRQVIVLPPNGAAAAVDTEAQAYAQHEAEIERLETEAELAKAEGEDAYKAAAAKLSEARRVAFAAISRERHNVALAKVPAVVEHCLNALEDGRKLIVFAHHHDVIDGIRHGLGAYDVAVLTGDTPLAERQAAVDRFQSDARCKVFLASITAAGVGLTLTAASHVIFAELDWVPGNVTQAEDRAHRIGQASSVLVQHLVLDRSLDAKLVHTLIDKQDVVDRALDRESRPEAQVAVPATTRTTSDQLSAEADKLTPEQIPAIHEGLRLLRAACDGAHRLDAVGFNKLDANVGRQLADRPSLSRRQAALGRRLVRKYRRQLPQALIALAVNGGEVAS